MSAGVDTLARRTLEANRNRSASTFMAQSRRTRSPRTRRSPRQRKLRTREHVIADLSLYHLSGPVLRAGFTIEAHGLIFVQLKATDNIETCRLTNGDLSFPIDIRDLD